MNKPHGSDLPLSNDNLLAERRGHAHLAFALQHKPRGRIQHRHSQTVFTFLTVTIATCSGLILWCEWRNDPADQSEYGEWTNKQLFYAIVFAISFFVGFISLVSWYFSA